MSSRGGRTRLTTAGIIAAAALVAALFAGAARTAGAVQAIAQPPGSTAVAGVDHQGHLAAPHATQPHLTQPHRRWQHPWGTARDTLAVGMPLTDAVLGLLVVAAVRVPRGAWGAPAVAGRQAVGRGPPALVA